MGLIYRYYLKRGEKVETFDGDTLPAEFDLKDRARLTLAMLCAGVDEDIFLRAKNFFVDRGYLIRSPVFVDDEGKEHIGQNKEYFFDKRGKFASYYGLKPSQSAQVLLDAIKDGFDIYTQGGLGFAQNNRKFFDEVEKSSDDYVGKYKPRIYGYSNVSNSIILQEFFDYIHSMGLAQFPGCLEYMAESAKDVLSIIDEKKVDLKRKAVAINEEALALVRKSDEIDLKIRSYPINLSTFFYNNYNSDYFFKAPKEDYSFIIESIVWWKVEDSFRAFAGLKNFLQRLKITGQKLPIMIEAGNFTDSSVVGMGLRFEDGRVKLSPKHARELTQDQYHEMQKKNDEFAKSANLEMEKICNEFNIAFFEGGEKRIGHAKDNQVQPSGTICKVVKDGYFLEISSSVQERSLIALDDVKLIEKKKQMPKLKVADLSFIDAKDVEIELDLIQISGKPCDLSGVKSANFASFLHNVADLKDSQLDEPCAFILPKRFLTSAFASVMEPELLSGKMGVDFPPIVMALSADLKKSSAEEMNNIMKKWRKMIKSFCLEHNVERPIYLARDPVDLLNDPKLEVLLKGDGVVKYQTRFSMSKDFVKSPSVSVAEVDAETAFFKKVHDIEI